MSEANKDSEKPLPPAQLNNNRLLAEFNKLPAFRDSLGLIVPSAEQGISEEDALRKSQLGQGIYQDRKSDPRLKPLQENISVLLNNAPVTDSFKQYIQSMFKRAFLEGVDREQPQRPGAGGTLYTMLTRDDGGIFNPESAEEIEINNYGNYMAPVKHLYKFYKKPDPSTEEGKLEIKERREDIESRLKFGREWIKDIHQKYGARAGSLPKLPEDKDIDLNFNNIYGL